MRVVLDEIAFELEEWKQLTHSDVAGHHPIHWRPNRTKRQRKEEFVFCLTLLKIRYWFSFAPKLRLVPLATLLLRLSDLDWSTASAFLGLLLADGRQWGFSASIIMWGSLSLYIHAHMYILLLFQFLWRPLTNNFLYL